MDRESQGLTAQDFHHGGAFVNPLDIFPPRSRLAARNKNYRSPLRDGPSSRSRSRTTRDYRGFACCDEGDEEASMSSNAPDCCVDFDHGSHDSNQFDQPIECCDEPHHSSPSPMDCEDCVDDCDDCVEEHIQASQRPCNFGEECEDWDQDDPVECPAGPACQDACDECDFSCFDCVDWNEFEQNKDLGLSYSVPLLGATGITEPFVPFDQLDLTVPHSYETPMGSYDATALPLDIPMHHQCAVPYWNGITQEEYCSGLPGLAQQLPLPPLISNFGCHPATAHQQGALPALQPYVQQIYKAAPPSSSSAASHSNSEGLDVLNLTQDLLSAINAPSTSKSCQWLMPCGTVCGASFATGTDLKKHIKTTHLSNGVTKCRWQGCESADFASEGALTGHVSKKHLASILIPASSRHKHKHHTHPARFKCSFPDCDKSFMHKHIRDEHVATHHGGNKMYCPICKAYLNGEGSNFKRHMATHRPKHQHTLCKYHDFGCKRRFPRLDNLRRHEACCKFGKRLSQNGRDGHEHHHHHVHV